MAAQPGDASNTIASAKRLMGRGLADIAQADKLPYDLVDAGQGGGMVSIATADGTKSPVEVSAEILASLRQRAEDTFDEDLYGAVITVPAYFDDAQRQATRTPRSWRVSISCALSMNPRRPRLPMAWTTPAKAFTPFMTWAAEPLTFPFFG